MLFSFIVPVYNTSKYLDKCIQSLLCQEGAKFEILLVDDGSTDNSGKMCDDYAKRYPDMVRVIHKENEGLLLTRRRGFQEAKGDWLLSVDSDDYIADNLLKEVVSAIDQYSPDLVMYNFQYFNDAGEITKSRLNIPDKTVFQGEDKQYVYEQRLTTDDINSMCMKAVKREILDVDGDYSHCGIRNMCEDAVQCLAVFTNAQKIVYLDSPLYNYRKGQDSLTSTRTYENWLSSRDCFFFTEPFLDEWNVSKELRRKFYTSYTEYLSNFIRWAFSQSPEKLDKPLSDIIHTICTHPSFERCMKNYDKTYSKTKYLKFCVPKIMKNVQKENIKGLKRFFAMEHKLLSRR